MRLKKIYGPCVSLETWGGGCPEKGQFKDRLLPLTWLSHRLTLSIWQVTQPKETALWFSAL